MANEVQIKLAVNGSAAAQDQLSRVESRLGVLNGTLVKTAHYGVAMAGAFGLVLPAMQNTVRATIGAADAVTTLQNTLRLATGSAAQAGQAYSALFDIAQKSRVSFTELGNTFASISRAGQELGVSQARLLTVTQSIGNAMAISGGSAQGMQAALTQLGQGLSSGTLRGEELNSVMEQAPRLARALADGLGVPLGELRKLGEAGELTAEQVIYALEKAGPQLAKEIESSVMTVGQAMTVLGNAATRFVGELDQATGASNSLAAGINALAGTIASASTGTSMSFLTDDFTAVGEAMDRAKLRGAGFWGQLNDGTGMLIGRAVGLGLVNRDFMTLTGAVADATAALKRLDDQEKREGKLSIYSMNERATAARDLARANRELAQSKAAPEVSDTQQGVNANGRAREKYMADQAKAQADLNALRNKLSGVPESYLKDMTEIIRLNQAGVLVGKEYTDVLAKQQATLIKKTGTVQSVVKGEDEAAKGLALYSDLLSKSEGFAANYAEQLQSLSRAAGRGALSLDQVSRAVALLNAQQPGALAMANAEEAALEAALRTIDANDKITNSYLDARASARAYIDTITRQNAREVSGMGRGTKFRAEQAGISAIEDKQTTQRQALDGDLRNSKIDRAQYDQYLGVVNETYTKEVALYRQRTADMTRLQADWSVGASEALANYLVDAQDVAGKVGGVMAKAFKGMEDALVSFVQTGKLDFNGLANSIIADMARIAIQQSITAPLAAAASSFFAGMFANGGAFDGGVQAFAKGGTFTNSIVDSPTLFKFAKGTGLMGEAGPEAIMPLSRGADGKLGVVAQGVGGGSSVVVNVIEAPGQGGQQSRRSENGVDMIDVFVEKIKSSIAGDISRGSGAVPAALSRNYGLNRVAGAY